MHKTIYLTVHGFADDRLYLKKPDGSAIAVPVQEIPSQELETIQFALANPLKNWNDSGPAPVRIIADVELDEATGKYLSLAFMGTNIQND